MSHDDQHAAGFAARGPSRHALRHERSHARSHAGLERPSLFAGMEDDDGDGGVPDQVRLLASLGSHGAGIGARHRSRRVPGRRAEASGPGWWGSRWLRRLAQDPPGRVRFLRAALVTGALLAGLLVMAHGLRLAFREGPLPASGNRAEVARPAPPALAVPGLDAASAAHATREAPARIEALPLAEAGPRATPSLAPSVARTSAAPPVASPDTPTPPPATAPATRARPRPSDDVALLEAMMEHAGRRRAPTSATEALQACSTLQGTEAAACRARACVQHPTATPCHDARP